MYVLIPILAAVFAAGFGTGFAVRAAVSTLRRARAQRLRAHARTNSFIIPHQDTTVPKERM